MPFSLQKFATDLPDSCQDLWIADQSRFAMLRSPYLLTWRHIDIRLGYAESGGIDALTLDSLLISNVIIFAMLPVRTLRIKFWSWGRLVLAPE